MKRATGNLLRLKSSIGASQQQAPVFKLNPNPGKGLVQTDCAENGHIHVYDQLGKVVKNINFMAPALSPTLQPGIYVVAFFAEDGLRTQEKLVVR